MNRHEFINYASAHGSPNIVKGSNLYNKEKTETEIRKKYTGEFNSKIISEFFDNIGFVKFKRVETGSGDILTIELRRLAYVYLWKDTGAVVNRIGYVGNCAGIIKVLYMSEDGKFYGHDHRLIANGEEQFFDYLASEEYDFHPIIKKRVLDVLCKSGWYEGRNIDITGLDSEMKRFGVSLSQEQRNFLSEYCGISFECESEFCTFYSPEQILLKNKPGLLKAASQNMLEIGETFNGPFHIDSKGLIRFMGIHLMGRTADECVNHLVKDIFGWDTEPDETVI